MRIECIHQKAARPAFDEEKPSDLQQSVSEQSQEAPPEKASPKEAPKAAPKPKGGKQ